MIFTNPAKYSKNVGGMSPLATPMNTHTSFRLGRSPGLYSVTAAELSDLHLFETVALIYVDGVADQDRPAEA